MKTPPPFDFHAYLFDLVGRNRLAAEHSFVPCSCSGLGFLEEMLRRMREARAFVCLSDVCEESTTHRGGAWFKRRVFTVFVVARYDVRRLEDYRVKLSLCRELFRQLHTRFILDEARLQSGLVYLDVANVRSRELGGEFLNGLCGLYFTLALDEPIDLCYNAEEWISD